MVFYLRFRRSYEHSVAKNEFLKKRLEDSNINLVKLQETHAQWEKEIVENDLAVQAKIKDLESKLEAVQVISESVLKDHSEIHAKFTSAKVEADRLNMKLLDAMNEITVCRNRAEVLSQSILDMKVKFRRAKEKLRKYKEKARSFYRQLTFASWG
jgi:predicted  nucleic acid-binding Zn-ribbon protein